MISIPALLSTGAWAAIVVGIIIAFGRTEGGGWSIAGGVARGVRDWSRERRAERSTSSSSSPSSGQLPPMAIPSMPAKRPAARRRAAAPEAELEEVATRRLDRT
jgi:hypothetical protein